MNRSEEITSIRQAAQYLDDETVTIMLLEVFGKIDLAQDVLSRKEEESKTRYGIAPEPQNDPRNEV